MARQLPLLRDWNRAFWTSGEDGQLRFQHCTACDRLQHPPAPVCRSCGQDDLDEQAVSGRATVQGHTWSGREGAPVAAVVAIDEDPDLHLTTNLVGVDPESVKVGMRVQVTFEPDEDVWLPLFEPTGDPPGALVDEDLERLRSVRPMARTDKFEDRVALTGIGRSEIGRKLMRSPLSLTVDAVRAAVDRRRPHDGGRRRPLDLSRHGRRGRLRRGRGHRRRGRAGPASDLAQRRLGGARRHGLDRRRDARRRRRSVPPRRLLPHRLAVELRRAGQAR